MTLADAVAAWDPFARQAANHLWQSTLFALAAGLLALALRKNHARTRCWLWMAASVKFLVPFWLLIAVGSHFGQSLAPAVPAARLPVVIEQIGQPFAVLDSLPDTPAVVAASKPTRWLPAILLAVWLCGSAAIIGNWWLRWIRVRAVVREARPLVEGREWEALRRLQRPRPPSLSVGRQARVPNLKLASSPAVLEPGLFGIFRPVLWLPAGIAEHLSDTQLEAILAHELCHARRRDNLAAAIHMSVEAVFWFHPLVWWLGARLVAERERACDEEVVLLGSEPGDYAEGVLQICRFYAASPLACAAGVTGADLKKRIENIMRNRLTQKLSLGKQVLLAAAAFLAVAAPIAVGLLNPPRSLAQTPVAVRQVQPQAAASTVRFDVASVKTVALGSGGQTPAERERGFTGTGGRVNLRGVNLSSVVMRAFDLQPDQISAPTWLNNQAVDISAVAPADTPKEKILLMFQNLLAERFKLKYHRETKVGPVYALVPGPDGVKLRPGIPDDDPENMGQIGGPATGAGPGAPITVTARAPFGVYKLTVANGVMHYEFQNITMKDLARYLSLVGRALYLPVIDATAMTGSYQVSLDISQSEIHGAVARPPAERADTDQAVPSASDPLPGSSIHTSIEKQGLRLIRRNAPLEKFVVDQMERTPTEN